MKLTKVLPEVQGGFFDVAPKGTTPPSKPTPKKTPRKAAARPKKALDCEACGLYKQPHVSHPQMEAHGGGALGILVLGEGPGVTEDRYGTQFIGDAGDILRRGFASVGIDLDEDCWVLNAVNCWTGPGNRAPSKKEVSCCREVRLKPYLELLKPRVVVLLGNSALESFYGERQSDLTITKFRGRCIPDRPTGAWVMPLFHPSFIMRGEHDANLQALWRRDLQRVAVRVHSPPPVFRDPAEGLRCLTDCQQVLDFLDEVHLGAEWISFDFETSGLKPFRPEHKIHTMAISAFFGEDVQELHSVSFPIDYPEAWSKSEVREIKTKVGAILGDRGILKVAQNMKFEDLWCREKLGVVVQGWDWCTMNNAHIVDNTTGITGLKFQAWTQFGVEGYDKAFGKYARSDDSDEEGENGINRVHEMPLDELLLYGGQDAVITAWLYQKQRQQIPEGSMLDNARQLFHRAQTTFCEIQTEGVPIDEEYYTEKGAEIQKETDALLKKLSSSPEARAFYKSQGRTLNLGSNKDLQILLFDVLKNKPSKNTPKGAPSVDVESLGAIDIPFTKDLLRTRKLNKITSTYFNQMVRESFDGKVYPFTNFNIPRTYRPSMSGPNLANIPKREKEAKLLVRRGIVAPPGMELMEMDYEGIEIHGLEWYSRDPVLLQYLTNPDTADVHRDQTQHIFKIPAAWWPKLDKDSIKLLRFYTKNKWDFPLFYGSYWGSCAPDLWEACADLPIGDGDGTTLRQHLESVAGIQTYDQFEAHIKQCEREFWDLFKRVRSWQDSISQEYQRKGYIETYLGFQYRGFMTRNELYNYKIQGTAFHLLLWGLCELHEELKGRQLNTRILWQIYDSIISKLDPAEKAKVVALHQEVMVDRAKEHFDWINTPIKINMEFSGVNGSFADLKEDEEEEMEALAA